MTQAINGEFRILEKFLKVFRKLFSKSFLNDINKKRKDFTPCGQTEDKITKEKLLAKEKE